MSLSLFYAIVSMCCCGNWLFAFSCLVSSSPSVMAGCPSSVKLLCDRGASVNAIDFVRSHVSVDFSQPTELIVSILALQFR